MVSFDIIVPSYKRPDHLRSCLESLVTQDYNRYRIIVVYRLADQQTAEVAKLFKEKNSNILLVTVSEPGVVHAINSALLVSNADVVALIDDDAIAPTEWLALMAAQYEDEQVIAVGGKDIRPQEREVLKSAIVGKITWYGKAIGRHHAGYGPARKVDILKGVNCSYRGEFLRKTTLDQNLLGQGAQVHWEICLGAEAKRWGGKVIYDPAIVVDHLEAPRGDEPERTEFEEEKFYNMTFNYAYAVGLFMQKSRIPFLYAYLFIYGTGLFPGVMMIPVCALRRGGKECLKRFGINVRASHAGISRAIQALT